MKRSVNSAIFHQGLFIKGTNIGNVLPSPNKTFHDLEMTLDEDVLVIKGATPTFIKFEVAVPLANVVILDLVQNKPKEDNKK